MIARQAAGTRAAGNAWLSAFGRAMRRSQDTRRAFGLQ